MTTATLTKTDKESKGEVKTMGKQYQKKHHIPKKLRKYRSDRGFTIYSLADKLGVSYSSVSYWETGEKFPRHSKIMQLEEIFGVGYSELFTDMTPEEIAEYEAARNNDLNNQTKE